MNSPGKDPTDEMLDEAAADWVCEREEGFSPEREQAFAQWRRASPRHEAAVRRVEEMLGLLEELPTVRSSLEARLARPASEAGRPMGARILRFPLLAAAAGVAAAVVFGWVAWTSDNLAPATAPAPLRYATDASGQRRIALSDGSLVDLNTGSEVVVSYGDRERRITLSAGEAHFDVAKDPDRPFIVTAGNVSVRAVGTAFNVKHAPESIDVLVVEGTVEVGRDAALPRPFAPSARPRVEAGEQTRVRRDDPVAVPAVEKVDAESMRAQLAWQEQTIPFVDLPLRDLVTQFNRRNATQIVLADAELGARRVGGMISMNHPEAFVRLLEQDGDIVVERPDARIIVLRRAR
jgi:transmembrane sensor